MVGATADAIVVIHDGAAHFAALLVDQQASQMPYSIYIEPVFEKIENAVCQDEIGLKPNQQDTIRQ